MMRRSIPFLLAVVVFSLIREGLHALGISVGLGQNRYLQQGQFFLISVVNRELVAQVLLPSF